MTPVVLIVDDQVDIRLMAEFALRGPGREVVAVADGAAARAHATDRRPAVVVMDYRLEHELGTDVIRQLRADGYDGPVVLFSAHVTDVLEDEAATLGVPTVAKTELDALRTTVSAALSA